MKQISDTRNHFLLLLCCKPFSTSGINFLEAVFNLIDKLLVAVIIFIELNILRSDLSLKIE
jgi:hypothetical protein